MHGDMQIMDMRKQTALGKRLMLENIVINLADQPSYPHASSDSRFCV